MSSGAWLILVCSLAAEPGKAPEVVLDHAMDSDPLLVLPAPVKDFSEKYVPLWLQALARPEAEFQRLGAETIAHAHAAGFPEVQQSIPSLIKIVSAQETHPAARYSAARALIVLDAQGAAPQLYEASQTHGADLRQLVEPALARWRHQKAYAVWRNRLAGAQARHRDLLLAIDCLGEVADEAALPLLLPIVHDPLRPGAARLAASRAAGRIKDVGLESDAEKLSAPASPLISRLCSVALLGRHSSQAARAVLVRLAKSPEPSVAAAALARLNEIGHELVLPLAQPAIESPDEGVRRQGAICYIELCTPERIPILAKLLGDPHPELRGLIRRAFFARAQLPEFSVPIRQAAMEALKSDDWRAQEQALLLLGGLDYEPAAPRMVELLESPRGEVMVASAWGLRKLAVKETLPAMLDKATRQTQVRLEHQNFVPLDGQVSHLFEGLALMKHEPAEPLMKQYIAKNYTMGELSRTAAIWGLGHLHAGRPDDALAASIAGRVTESGPATPPEMDRVRVAGAIALGKMKAASQADALRKFAANIGREPYLAIRWSLKEITGEVLPDLKPAVISKSGWFLEPLE